METIFSKIINGKIPCYKIAEDEKYFAFLDINPLAIGHSLVVPKHEVDYIFDMNDDELSGMIVFAKKIAQAIKKQFPCEKIGMAVIGLEVPHAHIHLIPLNSEADISFQRPRATFTPEEYSELAKQIINAIA